MIRNGEQIRLMSRQSKELTGFGEIVSSSKQKIPLLGKDIALTSTDQREEETVSFNSIVEDIL